VLAGKEPGAKLGFAPAGLVVVADELGADVGTETGVTGDTVGFTVPPELGEAVDVFAGD
jgi:hypothetical protein